MKIRAAFNNIFQFNSFYISTKIIGKMKINKFFTFHILNNISLKNHLASKFNLYKITSYHRIDLDIFCKWRMNTFCIRSCPSHLSRISNKAHPNLLYFQGVYGRNNRFKTLTKAYKYNNNIVIWYHKNHKIILQAFSFYIKCKNLHDAMDCSYIEEYDFSYNKCSQ